MTPTGDIGQQLSRQAQIPIIGTETSLLADTTTSGVRAKPKSRSSGLKPIQIVGDPGREAARQAQIPIIGTETVLKDCQGN